MSNNLDSQHPFEGGELNEEGLHVHPNYDFPKTEGDLAREERAKEANPGSEN